MHIIMKNDDRLFRGLVVVAAVLAIVAIAFVIAHVDFVVPGDESEAPESTGVIAGETSFVPPVTRELEVSATTTAEVESSKTPQTVYFPATVRIIQTEPETVEETTSPEPVETTPVETEPEIEPEPATVADEPDELVFVEDAYSWLREHDSDKEICSLEKKFSNGVLFVRITCGESRYVFECTEMAYKDTDWEPVDEVFSSQELNDLAYLVHRECGSSKSCRENLQAQVAVIFNRMADRRFKPTTIRGIIEDHEGTKLWQYTSSTAIKARKLKSNTDMERSDLTRCFQEGVLPVLVNEALEEIPEDVVYAAAFAQGISIWKTYDGTKYCRG